MVLRFYATLLFRDAGQKQNSKELKLTKDLMMAARCFHVAGRK